MSFEEHIKKNKEELNLKEVNPMLWESISMNIETPDRPSKNYNYLLVGGLALALLLMVGYFIYQSQQQTKLLNETQQQLYAVRAEINSLLNEQSSFSRIKAVNMSAVLEESDPEIIRALFYTAQNDKSKNVRLAALNAIEKFADQEEVKTALITTLQHSEEPFVQIRIINILSAIGERRVIPLLEDMMKDNSMPNYIKSEAASAKSTIEKIY